MLAKQRPRPPPYSGQKVDSTITSSGFIAIGRFRRALVPAAGRRLPSVGCPSPSLEGCTAVNETLQDEPAVQSVRRTRRWIPLRSLYVRRMQAWRSPPPERTKVDAGSGCSTSGVTAALSSLQTKTDGRNQDARPSVTRSGRLPGVLRRCADLSRRSSRRPSLAWREDELQRARLMD
ncbi:hypothetical protein HPB47_014997 [Ixodes persulcatus]|uniref:Uncharacterized protein n=1 Tax=Ixodes persulcatus TaxID=34615 RepID=A0AC60QY60_IXOPE|nr:hypothetical protein HPB47_014997 [Ixodes persulcatus]